MCAHSEGFEQKSDTDTRVRQTALTPKWQQIGGAHRSLLARDEEGLKIAEVVETTGGAQSGETFQR